MIKFRKYGRLAAASFIALAIVACSKTDKAEKAADILQFVPADTPYVVAALEPTPQDLYDKLEPVFNQMMDTYGKVIETAIAAEMGKLPEDSEKRAEVEKASAVVDELMSIMSLEGLRGAGIDRESQFVMYGNGLLPVVRIRLTDPELFESTIERVEEKAEQGMSTAEIDGQPYRFVDLDELKIVLGTFGDYAVVTLMPSSFDDKQLRQMLGLERPAENIASSGRISAVAEEFGFTKHMVAIIDSNRLASIFLDEPTGLNADLLAIADYDAGVLGDVCREEIRSLVGIAPRVVMGYTRIDDEQLDSTMVIELRDDIATGLATLPANVPGLGEDQGGLLSFGMGFNLQAVRSFYEARLDALEADPYECEQFADMQNGVAKGREILNQPVPPIVYDIRGFMAVVDELDGLDFASKRPPENVEASVVLAVDNASALVQLGSMFSPEIAALNLQPDGKAVQFSPRQLGGQVDDAYLALGENALAISVGASAESKVSKLLDAGSATPPPFMSMTMDAARYYALIGDAMMQEPGDQEGELPLETREALRDMMVNIGSIYERIVFDVRFTARGVEVDTVLTLGD